MKNQDIDIAEIPVQPLAQVIRLQAKEDFHNGLPIETYHKHGFRGGSARLYKAVWKSERDPIQSLTEKDKLPETQIKPCPFCGGDATLTQQPDRNSGTFWFVICIDMKCGCGLRPRRNPRAAIIQWNSRLTPDNRA